MGIAVITGASSGMGREFVLQLDKINNFSEIWVIARRKEKVNTIDFQLCQLIWRKVPYY